MSHNNSSIPTHNIMSQKEQTPLIRHKRLKVLKACCECRRKKAKCNGESPCIRCIRSNIECQYNVHKPKLKISNYRPLVPATSILPTSESMPKIGIIRKKSISQHYYQQQPIVHSNNSQKLVTYSDSQHQQTIKCNSYQQPIIRQNNQYKSIENRLNEIENVLQLIIKQQQEIIQSYHLHNSKIREVKPSLVRSTSSDSSVTSTIPSPKITAIQNLLNNNENPHYF